MITARERRDALEDARLALFVTENDARSTNVQILKDDGETLNDGIIIVGDVALGDTWTGDDLFTLDW